MVLDRGKKYEMGQREEIWYWTEKKYEIGQREEIWHWTEKKYEIAAL